MMWIGADWDSEKCVVAFVVDGKRKQARVRRHPAAVRQFMADLGCREVSVGIESGDRVWPKLWRSAGAQVFVFDGKKARNFSASLRSSKAKDDRHSADDLMAMVQSEAHRKDCNIELPHELLGLERLLKVQELTRKQTQCTANRLSALVNQVHPAFAQHVRSFETQWVLRILALAPVSRLWNELSEQERETALKAAPLSSRAEIAHSLGEDWGVVSEHEEQAVTLQMRILVDMLTQALSAKRQAEKALQGASEGNCVAQTLKSVDGVGPLLAVACATALASPKQRGPRRDHMAIKMGSAPVTVRSGVMGDRRPLVAMRRSSDSTLRNATHILGAQLVRNHSWAKAQFAYYRQHKKSAAGAYRRIGRSFSRIAHALVRDGSEFDEQRYISQLKLHGVSWAMKL